MKAILHDLELQTHKVEEAIDITLKVEGCVTKSEIREGIVSVYSMHTSSGLAVTEGLWDVEEDVLHYLNRLTPPVEGLRHNRFLAIDGRLGVNPDAHAKSVLCGYHLSFPIHEGEIVKGSRQRIFFLEFDGPLRRFYKVQVLGEHISAEGGDKNF